MASNDSPRREASSAGAATCRTGGSTAPPSPRSRAPAAARAPARSRPTTRTPPRWASRPARLRAAPARPGDRTRDAVVRDRRRRPTSTRPTPPPCTPRCGSPRPSPRTTLIGSVRSALGALRAALHAATARRSSSPPTSAPACPAAPDEAAGGDAAAALLVGDERPTARSLAEFLAWRQRHRGVPRPLAHARRRPLASCGRSASARPATSRSAPRRWETALKQAGVAADDVDRSSWPARTPARPRAVAQQARRRRRAGRRPPRRRRRQHRRRPARCCCWPRRSSTRGAGHADRPASASPTAPTWSSSAPPTRPLAADRPLAPVADQVAAGGAGHATATTWPGAGCLPVEPPRRPEPARPSASAAARALDWKFGFVGSERADGTVHLPPLRRRRSAAADGRRRPAPSSPSPSTGWSTRQSPPVDLRRRRLRRRRPAADRADRRGRRRRRDRRRGSR